MDRFPFAGGASARTRTGAARSCKLQTLLATTEARHTLEGKGLGIGVGLVLRLRTRTRTHMCRESRDWVSARLQAANRSDMVLRVGQVFQNRM